MRLKHVASLTLLGMALASVAQAQVITFDSEVIQAACTPDLNNSGASSAVITLDEVKVSAFANQVGATAGETPFTIGLNSCGDHLPANTIAGAYFYGATASNAFANYLSGVYRGRLTGDGGSDGGSGWNYQLLPGAGSDDPIEILTSASKPRADVLARLPATDVSSGSGTLSYRVRYYRVSAINKWGNEINLPSQINPGTRTAEVTYVLYYR